MSAAHPPTRKRYRRGTHRTVDPAQTIARFARFAGALGITRVADVTGLDYLGVPVFMAMRPNGRSLSVSQGKGLTADGAYVSAFMEAAELEHAGNIDRPRRKASMAAMRDRPVVSPRLLPRLRGAGLRSDTPLLWIAGEDLVAGGEIWLPYDVVHADFTVPRPAGSGYFLASTTGLASGNHVLEATCAGLCEVIERDATRLWPLRSSRDQAARRLVLSSVDDKDCRRLLDHLADRGIAVAAWDATTDLGVPCFICRIREAPGDTRSSFGSFWGAGCHVTRGVALSRAVTEAVQYRLTCIAGSRDDLRGADYVEPAAQGLFEALSDAWEKALPGRRFAQIPNHHGASFEDDLEFLIAAVNRAGLDKVVRVDLTDPRFGIPVVRIVVPGLEADSQHGHFPLPGPRVRAMRR